MIKRLMASALAGAFALAPLAASADGHACKNEVWNKVMSRGKIVVGVKADYKPWGYRDTSGDIDRLYPGCSEDCEEMVPYRYDDSQEAWRQWDGFCWYDLTLTP